jgi:hypothetical protein
MSRHQRRARRRRLLGTVSAPAILIAGVLGVCVAAPADSSPTFTVDDTADAPDAKPGDGVCATARQQCTLRAAVMEAGTVGVANIELPAGTYRLTIPGGAEVRKVGNNAPNSAVGDLDISTSVEITGAGPDQTIIDGMNNVRVFDIHRDKVNLNRVGVLGLSGLRIKNGRADYDSLSKHVHGGAIHNHGYLHMSHVAVDDNTAPRNWGGGGITNGTDGVANINESTVARNTSPSHGGGIENWGRLSMVNVTVAENQAPANNGGGLWNAATSLNISSSLVALNNGDDCHVALGAIRSGGYNLEGDGTCAFGQPTDLEGDPAFEAGLPGAPLYYPLSSYSPAEDTAGENNCSGTDIRGVDRPQDGDEDSIVECDMGSFEKLPGLVDADG